MENEVNAAAEKRRLFIRTYGCQMNEYDSQKLAKILEQGYSRVERPEDADLVLINTCSVREKPEQKLLSLLGELRELKQQHPSLLVGVGGCIAQREGQTMVERSSVVDFVFGTHNLSLVPSLIERRQQGLPPQVAVDYRDGWEELPLEGPEDSPVSALIAISRGCNKNCSFCVVPVTRGAEVSRDLEEILREARLAARRGAKEVMLLGQTVNSYGRDLEPKRRFSELLQRLAGIDEIKRIRFVSPHPQEVREDFIELVAGEPKICRHIHMPLQSGSNAILKAMNRNYRRERYLRIIEELKTRASDMAISTDIIVGFPGESEEDFRQTLEVMDIVQYDSSFSFIYSPRPGTKAFELQETHPLEERLERLYVLQAKQEEITARRLQAWVGRTVEVLIDGTGEKGSGARRGRTSQNIVVNLTAEGGGYSAGSFVRVRITEAARHTLRGEIIP